MTGTIRRTCTRLARRPLFLALSAFGLILVAIGVIYASRYFPARAKLDAAIAEARANGEPVWFSDLDPGPERNPSADAKLLLSLANELVLWEDGDVLDDKIYDLRHPDRAEGSVEFTQAEYGRLAEYAAANDRVLREMAEVAKRGDCWFEYDYSTVATYGITLGHVDALRNTQPAAATQVLATIGSENEGAFVDAMSRYFELAECLQNDPWLVSSGVRLRWVKLGITLIERRMNHSPLTSDTNLVLAERLAQVEQRTRLAPIALKYGTSDFTVLANLDHPENRVITAAIISGSTSWTTSSANTYWFEDILNTTPEERQVARWNSHWNRPQLMMQQALAIDLRRRACEQVDIPGPAATEKLRSVGAELLKQQDEMPLLYHLLPDLSRDREHAMSVRQRLINATLLLELAATNADKPYPQQGLKESIDTAIDSAPAGYFSGNPLQYAIEESTISVFDVNPPDGERVGKFSLRLFGTDELDVESTQVPETSAAGVGAP